MEFFPGSIRAQVFVSTWLTVSGHCQQYNTQEKGLPFDYVQNGPQLPHDSCWTFNNVIKEAEDLSSC